MISTPLLDRIAATWLPITEAQQDGEYHLVGRDGAMPERAFYDAGLWYVGPYGGNNLVFVVQPRPTHYLPVPWLDDRDAPNAPPAKPVPPGIPFPFLNHRSMAEVMASEESAA